MVKRGVVVGFYKDHGKTKPITKSNAQLNRRKNIVGARKFDNVEPGKSRKDVSQQLENFLERLSILEDQKQNLLMQKQLFEKAGKDSGAVDRQIRVLEQLILRQNFLIKKLGGKEHHA
jgi:hypothetical protein